MAITIDKLTGDEYINNEFITKFNNNLTNLNTDKLSLSGGTMTGNLTVTGNSNTMSIGTSSESKSVGFKTGNTEVMTFYRDGSATGMGINVTGNINLTSQAVNVSGSLSVAGGLTNSLTVNGKSYNGSAAVNAGTMGIAYGGTGLTSSPSMLTNLGSTSAANVLQASPRPGVTGTLPIANGGTGATTAIEAVTNLSISTAAYHNSVPRGKYLGSSVTDAQSTAITNGTFEDLFVGDYWTIGGVDWLIADFDYYYHTGDTGCTKHHVVIIPRTKLYTAQMNTSNTTTGAYVGSAMYTRNLATAKSTISSAFGSHVLTIRQYFQNATTNGYETGGAWYDATVWLMNESNVYGGRHFGNCIQGTNWANLYVVDNRQYAYFRYFPINEEQHEYWLRDVASSTNFCAVYGSGRCSALNASTSDGVRPAFIIQ